MSNANDWYSRKTVEHLGAWFVVPQRQKMWGEYVGSADGRIRRYTQLQLLDFVNKELRSRLSQVVPIRIKGRRKQFALVCSIHERWLDQGIKRGFAFVGFNQDGSLEGLNDTDGKLINRHVDIVQKEVNGYPVWRGVLDNNVILG